MSKRFVKIVTLLIYFAMATLGLTGCKENGVLILAPYGEPQQNEQMAAWASKVQKSLGDDYSVKVGFTNMEEPDASYMNATQAAEAIKSETNGTMSKLKKAVVFRAIAQAYGDQYEAMNSEVFAAKNALGLSNDKINEAPGFGYHYVMANTIKARLDKSCNFVGSAGEITGDNDLVASQSILNITMKEDRSNVTQETIDYLQQTYGFKKIRLIDDNSMWSLLAVNLVAGGRNVVVPYYTTMPESTSLSHGAMTWDGDVAIYYLPDGDKARRGENTILEDGTALGVVRHYVDGGSYEGGTQIVPDPMARGILILAPYLSERENDQVQAWAAMVADEFADADVKVGFTDTPAENIYPYQKASEAALDLVADNSLDMALIFKVVAKTNGDVAASMDDEVSLCSTILNSAAQELYVAPGFGYQQHFYDTIKARLLSTCDFVGSAGEIEDGNDLVGRKSILNITLKESQASVAPFLINQFKSEFGFQQVRVIDEAHGGAWTLLAVDLPAGGRNVVVPYYTTQSDDVSLHHGTMTWDGDVGIYYLPDGAKANRDKNTILHDASSLEVVRYFFEGNTVEPPMDPADAILLVAPYGEERQNSEVLAWSEKVKARYPNRAVELGFTGAGTPSYPYLSALDAAHKLNQAAILQSVDIFRVIVKSDGVTATAMDAEVQEARESLLIDDSLISDIRGFGYGQVMIDTIKARIASQLDFFTSRWDVKDGNDLVAAKSTLNIIVHEEKESVPQWAIDEIQAAFGFTRMRLIDCDPWGAPSLWPLDNAAGGRNVAIPYMTTMTDEQGHGIGTMTWDGTSPTICIYYLPDGTTASRNQNTILNFDSSLDALDSLINQ